MLIHDMLEETAKRYPDKVAVKHEEAFISFLELDEQSSKIAEFFKKRGIKEGDRVALTAEKNIVSVVAIFGILKAGGMYVPIDGKIPKDRLYYLLTDCETNVWMSPHTITINQEKWTTEFICYSYDYYEIVCEKKEKKKNIKISEDASAYIMYTSGSTGEPKGVEIYHKSVTNLMDWYCKEFEITHKDKILSFVPFWFDASICDIFSMAKTGATLVLPHEGINMFPNEFAQFLVDEKISIFFAPSSQFVLIMDALKQYEYPYMKTVMFGAEELAIKYVRELKEVFKGCELVNIYGPTECTDVVTFYRVPEEIPIDMKKVPIGCPYPCILTTLVNKEDISCDIEEVGELLVHGPNIMKGYWNKQEDTNNAFVCYSVFSSGMWYRTGDLVYQDRNGDYVYVGRKDRMIKSMGRRIPLEEIEDVLNEHPLVKEAVVMSRQDVNVDSRINIECSVVSLATLSDGELIRYCRTKLPDYMVPTKFYIYDTLPKLSNGKLNRNVQK